MLESVTRSGGLRHPGSVSSLWSKEAGDKQIHLARCDIELGNVLKQRRPKTVPMIPVDAK